MPPDTETDRERFNMVLSPQQKAQWEDYLDENPNVDSLSHLVRLAVSKEIAGSQGDGPNGGNDDLAAHMAELVDQNQEVVERLKSLEARLGTVEQSLQEDPDIQKLANEVFAVLPTAEQIKDWEAPQKPLPNKLPEEHGGPLAYSGEPSDIASLLDVSDLKVRNALDKVQADTARVRERGDGRYFKEV